MKPKKLSKTLTLNKKTIAYLNGKELKKIKGGCDLTNPKSNASILFCCNIPQITFTDKFPGQARTPGRD